ncbi:MAG: flagellar biosynthesis protein FlhA [Candidatus Binataceae bacterium]
MNKIQFSAAELALPIAVVMVLSGMLAPVGPITLDVLLTLSLTLSVAILVAAASGRRPLDFSAFPTVLLLATLFRLSLNVASTRLILLSGNQGPDAAGVVLESFGRLIVGGDYAVGLVVFTVLAIINFAVVTKGASRVAEVAARFTLDAMPGKQMAIDADLNAGVIGDQEAQHRRKELAREADFYAAMDGIGKFVRGDAVAAVLIMILNLGAGLFIGIFEKGLDVQQALHTYTILTVGDGLAAQIPALLTSTAAAVIVSRSGNDQHLPSVIGRELFRNSTAMLGAAILIGFLGLLPDLPHAPFLLMAGVLFGVQKLAPAPAAESPKPVQAPAARQEEPWPAALKLELGLGLMTFMQTPWNLPEQIGKIREQLKQEIGFTMPRVVIADNATLGSNAYRILLRDTELARGETRVGMSLALPGINGPRPNVRGIETADPAFGIQALWVTGEEERKARGAGYTIVTPLVVLLTHFKESVKANSADLITRRDVEQAVEQAQKIVPRIVEELSGFGIHLGAVYRVFRTLLAEGIAIKDSPAILEAIAAEAYGTKDPVDIAEKIRPRIGRIICEPLRGPEGSLKILVVEPGIEDAFFRAAAQGDLLPTERDTLARVEDALRKAVSAATKASGETPVVVVSPQIRRAFERVSRRVAARVNVLGAGEIPAAIKKTIVGRVE